MTARNGPSAAAENCWETEELGEAILETTAALKKQLNTVFWIGGSPCSGKSSIAQALAESYSCRTYLCDDAYEAHLESARPETQPLMSQVAAMTWDDIWMHSAEFLVEREVKFYEEEFLMIVRDLLALPPHPPLLAEGTALLPGRRKSFSGSITRADPGLTTFSDSAATPPKPSRTGWRGTAHMPNSSSEKHRIGV